jgi:hypothetical protein
VNVNVSAKPGYGFDWGFLTTRPSNIRIFKGPPETCAHHPWDAMILRDCTGNTDTLNSIESIASRKWDILCMKMCEDYDCKLFDTSKMGRSTLKHFVQLHGSLLLSKILARGASQVFTAARILRPVAACSQTERVIYRKPIRSTELLPAELISMLRHAHRRMLKGYEYFPVSHTRAHILRAHGVERKLS